MIHILPLFYVVKMLWPSSINVHILKNI